MKVSKKLKHSIDFADSGALSDLAFLLIVFFIVIAVFNLNMGFMLGLPQKGSTKIINVEEIIRLQLSADDQLFYQNEECTLNKMEELVTEKLKIRPNMTLLLKISPEATYQEVVNIIDVTRKLDVENFSFTMIEE